MQAQRWVTWECARVWASVRRALTGPGAERDLVVQSLKAAGAAILAWALVGWWWKAPMALMAPWTAVVLVQSTVYRSLRAGAQQMTLIGLGTLLAAGAATLTGNSMAAMALALPPAVLLGNYSRFGDQGIYAPTTAIFVLAYSSFTTTAIAHRLFEAFVGAVIGIAVNALVLPPVHLRDVQENLDRLGRDSAKLLRTVADDVEDGYDRTSAGQWHEGAQRLCGAVRGLDSARGWTRESYRFNPGHRLRRCAPPPPDHWDTYWNGIADRLESLTATLLDTAGESRRLAAPPAGALGLLTDLLRAAADACEADRAALTSPPPAGEAGKAREERSETLRRAWEAHRRLKERLPDHDHETATAVGGIAAQTQQLLYALEAGPEPAARTR
ncbi:FUSC family protein [Streptomyces sp. NPDC002835]